MHFPRKNFRNNADNIIFGLFLPIKHLDLKLDHIIFLISTVIESQKYGELFHSFLMKYILKLAKSLHTILGYLLLFRKFPFLDDANVKQRRFILTER